MSKIISISSIGDIHRLLGKKEQHHPLITLIDVEEIAIFDKKANVSYQTNFYTIGLKYGGECEITYGRNQYDFQEGSLVFSAPGQVTSFSSSGNGDAPSGWILCFHKDLITGMDLASKMPNYTYFAYHNNEALHLSEKEATTITQIVSIIQAEFSMNLDVYSNKLIATNLELLLNYCERFYGRQFITRHAVNLKGLAAFEKLLADRMRREELENLGLPTVRELAEKMGYSPNYLSDMLMKETGRRAQDYIHDYLIDEAKNLLLGTNDSISSIAYHLGYDYPEQFSRFFKKKVGLSPSKYREAPPN